MIEAHVIGAGQFDDVEKELKNADQDDPDTLGFRVALLQARIRRQQRALTQRQMEQVSPLLSQGPGVDSNQPQESVSIISDQLSTHWADLANLLEKMLQTEPNAVQETSILAVCNYYVTQGKIPQAGALVDKFLTVFPDRTTVLFYKRMLAEPQPTKISQQRRRQLEEQTLSTIAEPLHKAINLGKFYRSHGQLQSAAAEFKKVIDAEDTDAPPRPGQTRTVSNMRKLAASHLFEIALASEDLETAAQIAEKARRENLDDCEGSFFAARLDMVKKDYKQALASIGECLKHRPVFSHAYILRSNVNMALENDNLAVEDAQKAVALNPLDGTIAKGLASALYQRNRKLGNNISPEQLVETKRALYNAIRLNPTDLQLQSFYAEYISNDNPEEALAIRQRLQKAFPSPQNAILLGNMAMRMALQEHVQQRKEALFDIAESSFSQALDLDPQNRAALEAKAEFFRVTDQGAKAEQLLEQSKDLKLLWAHYFRGGRFDRAKHVLEQLYKSDMRDSSVVRGLLLVAQRTADKEAVKQYSELLISLDGSVDNHFLQVRSFLDVGLVKEAQYKLESAKERFPNEPGGLLLETWLAMRQGQLDTALELANKNLSTDRDNALAWRLRGQTYYLMTRYEQAIEDLTNSKFLLPEPITRIALAKAYLGAGRVEDAITELENAVVNPQAPAQAMYLLERTYVQQGRKEALRAFYDKALARFPEDTGWHNRAGKFAVSVRQFDRAEQLYAQALRFADGAKTQPGQDATAGKFSQADYKSALDGYLKTLLLAAGSPDVTGNWNPQKLDQLFAEANKHLDKEWAPMVYLRMAEARTKLSDMEAAEQYCRTALTKALASKDPRAAAAVAQRLNSLVGAEDVSKYCTQQLENDPDSVAANLAMFSLMNSGGLYNKALEYIDRCLALAPASSPHRTAYIVDRVSVLEQAYYKTSDNSYLRKAIAEYESLLDKMPNNTVVLNNLAYMLAENNEKLPEALEYAKRAYQAMPNNPGFLDTYAYVLFKNQKYNDADEFLQASLQQYMQNNISVPTDVYKHLGMVKEKLGAEPEALVYYKQALETGVDTLSESAKASIKQAIERVSNSGRVGR
jgi:tetratricopeptide (TPR) repeat protein